MEYLGVDTQRLMHRVADAEMIEIRTHQTARSEHHIEPLIHPADVTAQDPLTDAPNACADDLRQVGMIEGRDRDTQALAHVSCTPGRMKRISGLYQTRLECCEQIGPAFRVERQPIVETAGYDKAAQRTDSAPVNAILGARHHHRVLPRGMSRQPGVLRIQIAFDYAAGGRIEEGRIDEMHRIHRPSSDPLPASKRRARIAPL